MFVGHNDSFKDSVKVKWTLMEMIGFNEHAYKIPCLFQTNLTVPITNFATLAFYSNWHRSKAALFDVMLKIHSIVLLNASSKTKLIISNKLINTVA